MAWHFLNFSGREAPLWTLLLSIPLTTVLVLGGAQAFASTNACERTYRGDLVVEGNQVLEITGESVCVHGNIVVRDNAELILRDVILRMDKFMPGFWDNWAHFSALNRPGIAGGLVS